MQRPSQPEGFTLVAAMHLHILLLAATTTALLIGELTLRFGLSVIVLELALGVAIAPHGRGWVALEVGSTIGGYIRHGLSVFSGGPGNQSFYDSRPAITPSRHIPIQPKKE